MQCGARSQPARIAQPARRVWVGAAGSGPRLLLDVGAPVEQQRERLLLPKQNKRMNRNKKNERTETKQTNEQMDK